MSTLTLDSFDRNHPLYEKLLLYGIPNTKTEQYKKFPVKSIFTKEYTFKILDYKPVKEGSKLIIENGVVRESLKGVKIIYDSSFSADTEHYDVSYFMSHILSPIVISIEVEEDLSFELHHVFSEKDTFLNYRVAINTARDAKVEVYESFDTNGSENSFLLYGIDAYIEKQSTLTWIRNEKRVENEAAIIGSHRYDVHEHGACDLKTFDFGSANSLHLYKVDLDHYSRVNASHLLLATDDARRGNVVVVNHNETYAKSSQEARSILKENATGIFDAKIVVNHDAKYSNAAQNSKAILLDENAHMYAKPQLEIYIDELEASHGSSIGTLDEEALFYLQSRGVKLEDAQKMLVSAFANILVDMIDEESFVTEIRNNFEEIL